MTLSGLLARLRQVDVAYGGRSPVLRDLSLDIFSNKHLAVIGPNGCGKSTLLRLLQGELRPVQLPGGGNAGSLTWYFTGCEERSPLAGREYARLVSPRQQRLWTRNRPELDGENILLSGLDNALMVYGQVPPEQRALARELAARAGAAQLLGMSAKAMSRGQLRLMLILRALINRPRLLLLDEPFDSLDGAARRTVLTCLDLAVGQGATLVLSAHREKDIPALIVERLHLEKGRIVQTLRPDAGPANSGPQSPDSMAQARSSTAQPPCASILQSPDPAPRPAPQPPGFAQQPCAPALQYPYLHQSRRSAKEPGPERPQDSAPLLELRHVDVFIEGHKVLRDINWTVLPGERWLVSGPNGAGKSTLLRLIYGEEFAAFGGLYLWRGRPRPGLDELRAEIGLVSDRLQDDYAYDLDALGVVVSGLRSSIGLYGETGEEEKLLAAAWLERFAVGHLAGEPFFSLSSGNARRVLLARAMAAAPQTLLLDEPCSGLDAQGRELFIKALHRLAQKGTTLLYVSHRAEDYGPLFSHELHMEKGRVISARPRNPIFT